MEGALSPRNVHVRSVLTLLVALSAPILLAGCVSSTGSNGDEDGLRSSPLVQQQIDQVWQGVIALYPDAERPNVEVDRLVTAAEANEVISMCINAAGWKTTFDAEGVDSGNLTIAQELGYFLASYECRARFPLDPREVGPPSPEEERDLYAYFTGELTACLGARGIPTSDAPSFVVFSDTLLTADAWTPWRDVPTDGSIDIPELQRLCPQVPRRE